MLDLGEDDDGADRGIRSALPPRWWLPGVVYSAIYAGCAVATMAFAVLFATGQFHHEPTSGLPFNGPCFSILAIGTFLLCNLVPPIAGLWFKGVVNARTPIRYVATVGAVSGCLAGIGYFGLSFVNNRTLEQVGLVALFVAGPIPGLMWLVYRKPKPIDVDYDDEISGTVDVDLGNDE